MLLEPGLRVVRGPDWKWAEQDGGCGHLGTVVPSQPIVPDKPSIEVRWDRGLRGDYRVGYQDAYDLRLYDNGTVGVNHIDVKCDVCQKYPIYGIRWKCENIEKYNLCSACYHGGKANLSHSYHRIVVPGAVGVQMEKRSLSVPVEVKGLFPGAKVRVGSDLQIPKDDERYRYKGTLKRLEHWVDGFPNTGAVVNWPPVRQDRYRVGYKGFMDIKTKEPTTGGMCYLTHLPVLGYPVGMECVEGHRVGDHVTVNMEEGLLRELQQGHGDWQPGMADEIGQTGIIRDITSNQDIKVWYQDRNRMWIFHPAALTKVYRRPSSLVEVDESGDFRIELDKSGQRPTAPKDSIPSQRRNGGSSDSSKFTDQRSNVKIHEVSMRVGLEKSKDQSEDIAIAAAQGNEKNVREILRRRPEWVNSTCDDKSPLQLAVYGGFLDVAKLLIAAGADLDATDDDGDTALMFSVYGNHPEIVKFLLQKEANVNIVNNERRSALHQAVTRSYIECIKILLDYNINLNIQDNFGDTALHDAISGQSKSILSLLLTKGGINFRLSNKREFNTLQWAAMKGNINAVTKILAIEKELAGIRNIDGQTALHIAARNNFEDIVRILIVQGECSVDEYTVDKQTPLLLAVGAGHVETVEVLLKLWADVNLPDADGDTSLHVALLRQVIFQDVTETILIQKIKDRIPDQSVATSGLALACLLVEYRADLGHVNNKGQTPLDIVPDTKIHAVLKSFVTDGGSPGQQIATVFPASVSPHHPKDGSGETQREREQREKIEYYELQHRSRLGEEGRDNRLVDTGTSGLGENLDRGSGVVDHQELLQKGDDGEASGRQDHVQMQRDKERQFRLAPSWSMPGSEDVGKSTVAPEHRPSDEVGSETPVHIAKQQMEEMLIWGDHEADRHRKDNRGHRPEHILKQEKQLLADRQALPDPDRVTPGQFHAPNRIPEQDLDHIEMQARKECQFEAIAQAPSRVGQDRPIHRPIPRLDLTPQRSPRQDPSSDASPSPITYRSTPTPTTMTPNLQQCRLGCGNIADGQFKPCDHTIVCENCAMCFQLCPEAKCRQKVESVLKLSRQFPVFSNTDPGMGQQTPKTGAVAAKGATGDHPSGARRKIFEPDSELTKSILIQKNQKLEDEMLCPVCIDRRRELVFLCGHSLCEDCSDSIDDCPLCRLPITKRIKMY
ncbi:E3 ubiquitin-protein ligase MIB2-like isoform X1 [Lytechinus pictus]|uniref:E3 ubiquitin-protein ligase MIB2-like isoform X1 n=1 Tax=Lytechinus pictus TaxID=7653 RepID=UPI0030BA0152